MSAADSQGVTDVAMSTGAHHLTMVVATVVSGNTYFALLDVDNRVVVHSFQLLTDYGKGRAAVSASRVAVVMPQTSPYGDPSSLEVARLAFVGTSADATRIFAMRWDSSSWSRSALVTTSTGSPFVDLGIGETSQVLGTPPNRRSSPTPRTQRPPGPTSR
jgi:hypothetical protein